MAVLRASGGKDQTELDALYVERSFARLPARRTAYMDSFDIPPCDMELDTEKIDDAVLALLWLGLHDGDRAWKGFDWESMNRLHERGLISDPHGKAKSVVFTEEGLARSRQRLEQLFGRTT